MTLFAMNDNLQSRAAAAHPNHFEYDAIIVLAHHLSGDGQLDAQSRARMVAAVAAYATKQAPYIVTTGWDLHGTFNRPIAQAMREFALAQHAISPKAIHCDAHSRDTVGDAVFTKRNIIQALGAKHLLIISSDYHLARVQAIFAFVYGTDYQLAIQGVASATTVETAQKERDSLAAFVATFTGVAVGDDAAIWQRLRTRHPFYNGAVYPAI